MPNKVIEKNTDSSLKNAENLTDAIHASHQMAEKTAHHYGFNKFKGLEVEKQDIAKVKNFKDSKIKEIVTGKNDLKSPEIKFKQLLN